MKTDAAFAQTGINRDAAGVRDFVPTIAELGLDPVVGYGQVPDATHDREPEPSEPCMEDLPFPGPSVPFGLLAVATRRIGLATGGLILKWGERLLRALTEGV